VRADPNETGLRGTIKHHVAFAWIIASLLAVLVFAFAISPPPT
jgi:hypothetical protein